jgi:hypothetical protein
LPALDSENYMVIARFQRELIYKFSAEIKKLPGLAGSFFARQMSMRGDV